MLMKNKINAWNNCFTTLLFYKNQFKININICSKTCFNTYLALPHHHNFGISNNINFSNKSK